MLKLLYGNFLEMPKSLMVALCICLISPLLFLARIYFDHSIEYSWFFFVIFVSFYFHFYAGILLLNKSIKFLMVFFCSGFLVSFSPLVYHPYGTEEWLMYLMSSFFNLSIILILYIYIKTSTKVKEYFGV